jgi:putative Mg2+ transporter-C (MgtC) family protein
MDIILEELTAGLPDARQFARIVIRLLVAMLLGGIVGYQREHTGKPAGLRTHMLVAMGAALFVLATAEAGMTSTDVSRVIQGLATGIGFIGAGAILKLSQEREIRGLTTAAGLWMTAAMGVAAGLGRIGMALLSAFLTWFVLSVVGQVEHRIIAAQAARDDAPETRGAAQ